MPGTGRTVNRTWGRQCSDDLIVASGLQTQLHAYGTNVEGELHDILALVEHLQETLHAEGVARLSTAIKVGTRTDKESTLAGKRL
jgi:uncharacterized protein (TIGR00106 family)